MSKISLSPNASGTGTFTIASPNSNTDRTLTLPDNTGTIITTASTFAGTGPAFSAYLGANQSVTTSTFTKVQCNTEEFDTNSNYDNATNYRFTPTVAGYYQVNVRINSLVASTLLICSLYKNGAEFKRGNDLRVSLNSSSAITSSFLLYLNGSTDYIELYAYITGTSPSIESGATNAWFQASMVRGA